MTECTDKHNYMQTADAHALDS